MNHKKKREQLAKKIRQQHRLSIISANRNKALKDKSYNIYTYSHLNQILNYQPLKIVQINTKKRQEFIQFSTSCLAPLAPYITSLKKQANPKKTGIRQQIIRKIIILCSDCISLGCTLKQSSECLVQLSTLQDFSLHFPVNLQFREFIQSKLAAILQVQHLNTEVCVNFSYVIGNCYQQLIKQRKKTHINQKQITIEQLAIQYLQKLCVSYPFYHNCLLLLMWLLRNILLVVVKDNKNCISHKKYEGMETEYELGIDSEKLSIQAIDIIKSIVSTVCQNLGNSYTNQQYLLTSLSQSLELLNLLATYFCVFFHESDITQIVYCQNYPLKKIEQILAITYHNPFFHQKAIIMNHCCEVAISLVNLDTHIKQVINEMPIINKIAQLTIYGSISGHVCFQMVSKLFQQYNLKQSIKIDLIAGIFQNSHYILKGDKSIIQNRNRRISLIKLIENLINYTPIAQIRKIISTKYYGQFYSQQAPIVERKLLQNKINQYIYQNLIILLVNIFELVLIDIDYENVGLGLKILLILMDNWEIQTQFMEQIVKSNGVASRIIQICGENCPQNIFQLAATLSDTLNLQ